MKHGNSQAGKLPIFRARLQELQGDMSIVAFAEELNLSRQTVGFYLNGDRIPDAVTLLQISEKCNVSTDWLLGISETKSVEPQIRPIVEYTGLSEKSVDMLHTVAKESHYEPPFDPLRILNFLISNTRFTMSLLCQISEYLEKCQDHLKISNDFDRKCASLDEEHLLTLEEFDKEVRKELDVLFKYEDARDLALFRVTRNFNGLLDDLVDKFCDKSAEIIEDSNSNQLRIKDSE